MIGFGLLFHSNAPGSADELDMQWEEVTYQGWHQSFSRAKIRPIEKEANLGTGVSKFALKTLSLGEGVIRYTSKNAES